MGKAKEARGGQVSDATADMSLQDSCKDSARHLSTEVHLLAAKADSLEQENAKLRELARFIMHQCNDGNPRCDECVGWNDGECVALLRMRELGVDE